MDEIIGTAVLCGNELFVVTANNRGVDVMSLPVRPRGTPRRKTPEWEYSRLADVLCVTPSVHVQLEIEPGKKETIFHNSGSWSVAFMDVPPHTQDPWDLCASINHDLIKERRATIRGR